MSRAWLSFSTLLVFLAGCVRAPEEVTLGVISPLNRNSATLEGAELATALINKSGGIELGDRRLRLRLLSKSSEGSPEVALRQALRLLNQDGVVALLGLPFSTDAFPVARVAEEHQVPFVTTLGSHPEITAGKEWAFRMTFVNSFQGRVLANFCHRELGARRAAVLLDVTSDYSRHLAEVFDRTFSELGGEVVAQEELSVLDDVPEAQLRRIAAARPDVLLMPYYYERVTTHMELARSVGIEATFVGGDSWNLISFGDRPITAAATGSYFVDAWSPERSGAAFADAYRKTYGATPTTSAALAYDAVFLIAEAIKKSGDATPRAIRDGIASLDAFTGVSGTIRFEPSSGDPARSAFICHVGDDLQVRLYREIVP